MAVTLIYILSILVVWGNTIKHFYEQGELNVGDLLFSIALFIFGVIPILNTVGLVFILTEWIEDLDRDYNWSGITLFKWRK